MTNYERYLATMPLREPPVILMASDAADHLMAELIEKETAALIIVDPDTAAAVSAYLKLEILRTYGHRIRMLPRNPLPTLELVKEIAAEAKEHSLNLIIGAGSGVISDLAKQASCEAGIRNWCLMTAASVDAFTSGTAAIRVEGYHESLPTRAAERVYCDIRVLAEAPRPLTLAGLGDLAGKFIAVPDWHMSFMVNGESFNPVAAEFAAGSAALALKDLDSILSTSEEGCMNAADAVLTSGLIMQSLQSSRPASSTEHILAHFWEVEQLVGNREWDLHGVLVAAASRLVIRAYRDILDLIAEGSSDPGRGEYLFSSAPAAPDAPWLSQKTRAKLQREIKARDNSPEGHKTRVEKLVPAAEDLVKLYTDYLETAERGLNELGEAGLPLSLGSLGIDRARGRFGINNIRFLRNRYTLVDAARDLGYDREAEEILNRAYDSCF